MKFLNLQDVQFRHLDVLDPDAPLQYTNRLSNECEHCGRRMLDTALVCQDCSAQLADRLRHAADMIEHAQDAVGGNTRVESVPFGAPKHPSLGMLGPSCRGEACSHESCYSVWVTRVRVGGEVERGAREHLGPVDWGRSERLWVARNTADAWVALVDGKRGNLPRPKRRPRPAEPQRAERVQRCDYSDLPKGTCACSHCCATAAGTTPAR